MHTHNLSRGQVETVLGDSVVPQRLWRYMGGTDPIRALGMQAKVSQVTNTYAMPRGVQTELHSPHSISEQGLEMYVFRGNNVEMGKQ